MPRKKTAAQLDREIAKAVKSRLKELSAQREQLFRSLGYAGLTAEQVKHLHKQIEEVDAKVRALGR